MAEGLIPYIYRAIKRMRREQKYYRSLSTGQSNWFSPPSSHREVLRPPAIKLGSFSEGGPGETSGRHRRYQSMQDFYAADDDAFSTERGGRRRLPAKEMARFGSSRSRSSRVFSCITGGVN